MEVVPSKSILGPKIEEYDCYREFLRDYYAFKKNQFSGFTFRRFSQLSGFKSPNFIQLVIKGERNLTLESARKIAKGLKLKREQTSFFEALVREAHAKDEKSLQEAKAFRLRALRKILTKQVGGEKIKILEKWYHFAVREVVALDDFIMNPDYVSEALLGLISPDQARESMALLIREGIIKQDSSGRWVQADLVLDACGDELLGEMIKKFHEETLKFWSTSLGQFNRELRNTSCLTMSVSKKTAGLIKEKMRNFEDEIIGMVGKEKKSEIIVQLGTYLIPFKDERP